MRKVDRLDDLDDLFPQPFQAPNAAWDGLVRHINDIVILADLSGVIFYASPACSILGYSQDELIGGTAMDFVHPDDLAHFNANGAEIFSGRQSTGPVDREHRIRHKDGSWVWMQGSPHLLTGKSGNPVGLINVFRDVTARRQFQTHLEESEKLHRLLTENTTDMISQTAADGRMIYLSPSVERMTGYSIAELMPRQMREFVHPDDLNSFLSFYGALVSGRAPGGQPIRYRVRHKDGTWLWLESCPKLVASDEPGELDCIVDVSRNVNEQEALKARLSEARAEAEASAAAKAEFLANMSHEIRTPLTAVLGFASLLEERPDLDPVARGYVTRVAGAGRGLLSIVNDVLDFSKLDAGQMSIAPRPTAVSQLAREVLEMFETSASEKGLQLRFSAASDIPPLVSLDGDRFRQVLINLVGNAVKFTDRGSVTLRLRYNPSKSLLVIEVADTGPGIAQAERSKLFERFSQVDSSSTRAKGGTGLGLAICQRLSEAMGGRISLRSRAGRGAVFSVELPAPSGSSSLVDVAVGEERASIEGARVLIVDDNTANRELARAILEGGGAEVTEAFDGESAVQIAADLPLDVVLMDIRMPGMGGVAAARAIRASDGPNGDTPILAFSADFNLEAGAFAGAELFDGEVLKPTTAVQLFAALMKALSQDNGCNGEELRHAHA